MHGRYIYDGRNILEPSEAQAAGFVYRGIGRRNNKQWDLKIKNSILPSLHTLIMENPIADRFMEIQLVAEREQRAQYLDKMELERERGITIKAQTVAMPYTLWMVRLIC